MYKTKNGNEYLTELKECTYWRMLKKHLIDAKDCFLDFLSCFVEGLYSILLFLFCCLILVFSFPIWIIKLIFIYPKVVKNNKNEMLKMEACKKASVHQEADNE